MTLKIDVDIDDRNKWNAIYTLLKTLSVYCGDVEYYETKHVYHVKIHGLPNTFELRAYFGDDVNRLERDMERVRKKCKHHDILFDQKNNINARKSTFKEVLIHVISYGKLER